MQYQNRGNGQQSSAGNGVTRTGVSASGQRQNVPPRSGSLPPNGRTQNPAPVQNGRAAQTVRRPDSSGRPNAQTPVRQQNSAAPAQRTAPPATGSGQTRRTTPEGYRSAAPYSVPPRQNRDRLPYPTREAYLLKKRKERRKKRLIAIGLLALIFIILFLLLFLAGRALVLKFKEQHKEMPHGVAASDTAEPGDSEEPPENGETASEPETLPDYSAVHMLTGQALVPHTGTNTVTLGEELDCPYAVFLDAENGEILAQKFETKSESTETEKSDTVSAACDVIHSRIYPASMTKLMSMLVAYENCENLNDTFRMTYEIIDPLYLSELALAGFVGGEDVTVRDLLYGAALPSGAEAAMGLALYTSGDEKTFVQLMNDRAKLLGMNGTHFTNCTGLHDTQHYSTLTDMAILISYMEQNPELAEILSTYQYTTTPTSQHPEGLLLTSTVFSRMEGSESGVCEIIGGKTGYTAEAQQCLAVYGVRKDTHHAFAAVFASADNKWKPVYDAIYLYQFHTGEPPADSTDTGEEAPG